MKTFSILMALLVSGTLSAQGHSDEVSARVILFGESIQTRGILLGQQVNDKADAQTGLGLRIMGQISSDSAWWWELGGRFNSSAHMATNRMVARSDGSTYLLDATKVKVEYSYWSVGAGYLVPLGTVADFGVHFEGRGETLNSKGDFYTNGIAGGTTNAHAVYFRPWVRLSLDLKVKTGSYTMVFGGEAGVAAIKTDQRAILFPAQVDDQTLRAMAPTWSGALYAGIQF